VFATPVAPNESAGSLLDANRRGPVSEAEPNFEALLLTLVKHDVRFVLIGAFAAALHGWNQPTEDVDITPDRDALNLVRLAEALEDLQAMVKRDDGTIDTDATFDDQLLRLQDRWLFATKFGDLDIVSDPAGFVGYATLLDGATQEEIGSAKVTVASLDAVIQSKEAVGRAKDRAVLPALRRLLAEQRRARSPRESNEPR